MVFNRLVEVNGTFVAQMDNTQIAEFLQLAKQDGGTLHIVVVRSNVSPEAASSKQKTITNGNGTKKTSNKKSRLEYSKVLNTTSMILLKAIYDEVYLFSKVDRGAGRSGLDWFHSALNRNTLEQEGT